jgi:nucleotide-binding universal stress UspA family protein
MSKEGTVRSINRIVFATDFSDSSAQAFPYALLLAEAYRAQLYLFHAVVLHADDPHSPTHRFPDRERLYEQLHDTAEVALASATTAHDTEVQIYQASRRALSPLAAILDFIEECGADLVVMGTHGRSGVGRLLLGSVAREVVRLCPCPVLTVRGRGQQLHRIDRVAVPVDFSDHSALALNHGCDLAALFGARLQIAHVVEEALYPEFYYPVLASPLTLTPAMRQQVEDQLRVWLRDKMGGDLEADVHVVAGRPAHEITALAEMQNSDLIVISSHGRTGFRRALMGSVAEDIVAHAACPVFTVKAFGQDLLTR